MNWKSHEQAFYGRNERKKERKKSGPLQHIDIHWMDPTNILFEYLLFRLQHSKCGSRWKRTRLKRLYYYLFGRNGEKTRQKKNFHRRNISNDFSVVGEQCFFRATERSNQKEPANNWNAHRVFFVCVFFHNVLI